MGSQCCSDCGRAKEIETFSALLELKNHSSDEPLPTVAIPVKVHVDIHPKVSEIHKIYRLV
jgi:hypothetical protein